MKYILCLAVSALALIALSVPQDEAEGSHKNRLIISGEALEVMPPDTSERGIKLQLVKYRVTSVCEGTYEGAEVLVYHVHDDQVPSVGEKQCVRIVDSIKPVKKPEEGSPPFPEAKTQYLALDVIRRCECKGK